MITVQQLLEHPRLQLRSLWCPHPQAQVAGVATSEELDPTPFLNKNDFLLTNTAGYPAQERDWVAYLNRLAQAEIKTLGIGQTPGGKQLPNALLRAARTQSFNLFEIPREQSFMGISLIVGEMLQAARHSGERKLAQIQQRLIASTSHSNQLSALAQVLSESLGAAIFLGPRGETPRYRVGFNRVKPTTRNYLETHWQQAGGVGSQVEVIENSTLYSLRCYSLDNEQWWLSVALDATLPAWSRQALSQAAVLIGSYLMNQQTVEQPRWLLQQQAFCQLIEGRVDTAGVLIQLAMPRACPVGGRYRAIVCVNHPSGRQKLASFARFLAEQETLTIPPPIIDFSEGRIRAFVSAAAWPRTLAGARELGVAAGVSEPLPLDRAKQAWQDAVAAGRQVRVEQPIVFWEEVVKRGVMQLFNPLDAKQFSAELLRPIGQDLELLAVLESFVMNNGNRLAIAQDLAIHRNTVRLRLQKIGRLLDQDLDDPGVRAGLWVAVEQRRLHKLP